MITDHYLHDLCIMSFVLSLTFSMQEFMKGYIARDRGIVVLSKNGAFPGTGV